MNPFYFASKHKSAFLANMAARLRDIINDDCSVLLKEREITTPITDISLMMFISESKNPSIAEIANALDYSHQRTSARVLTIEKLGLIRRVVDKKDSRCQRVALTEAGKTDFKKLQKVLEAASEVMDKVIAEEGVDIMQSIQNIVSTIKRHPISEQISEFDSSHDSSRG